MKKSKPLVSFLCPSYNHEKYVKYFIDSVLAQTIQDWELIIVDDCSTDNNVKEIQKYTDSRIKLIQHPFNMGINAGLNTAFEASNGEYVVFIASDDILEPNHLEVSTTYLKENPNIGAFYTCLSAIDENNNSVEEKNHQFTYYNISRFTLLRRLFYDGNVLPSPGLVLRRNILTEMLPLNISLLQYQDYKMHIDILLQTEIYISEQRLVRYRVPSENIGTSARIPIVFLREEFETNTMMDSFLKIKNINVLQQIFINDIDELLGVTESTIPFFIAKLALKSKIKIRQCWGYQRIMEFIEDDGNFQLLNRLYDFNFNDFLKLVKLEKDRQVLPVSISKKRTIKNIIKAFIPYGIISLIRRSRCQKYL